MQYVKTHFMDHFYKVLENPNFLSPNGQVLPSDHLEVSVIDRRELPSTIYGKMPDDVNINSDYFTVITQTEHDNAVNDKISRREEGLKNEIDSSSLSDTKKTELKDQLNGTWSKYESTKSEFRKLESELEE